MAVGKGLALATANLLVIAIGIAVVADKSVLHLRGMLDVAAAIIMYGAVPGLLTGVVLGWLGQVTETRDRRLRMLVVTVLAILPVVMLGETFDLRRYIVPASLPTIAAALALERWTRKRPAPPIPRAAPSLPVEPRID
jgi:hypothetical protein